ncbi:MAG TPA: AtpZ/AtpI family protein, partial [Stellaceae bacterium]|nr:AtpZ/AtpI family protein [Stellaceae bacterium]
MDERDTHDPLRDLQQRLDRARRERERNVTDNAEGGPGVPRSALGLAFRIGMELVVAVVVGTGVGWAFDRWLGTRPWGTIGFFFLGVGAGMVNVWRAVTGMGMAIGYRQQQPAAEPKKDADWSEDEE